MSENIKIFEFLKVTQEGYCLVVKGSFSNEFKEWLNSSEYKEMQKSVSKRFTEE